MQIEIDFEVYKALTARRDTEEVTYNDVIRGLLGLAPGGAAPDGVASSSGPVPDGYVAVGRLLPNGTALQARYKGKDYTAEIKNGVVVSTGGKVFKSLSAAAKNVTGNNVNGLRFWQAKRPTDDVWALVNKLPADRAEL